MSEANKYSPATKFLETEEGKISFDDSGERNPDSTKPLVICVPGIGDLKEQV